MIRHICATPLGPDRLAAYWLGDLAAAEIDAIDEQLMSCEACSRDSERMGLVAEGVALHGRALAVMPFLTAADLAAAERAGVKCQILTLEPDQSVTNVFPDDRHLVILRVRAPLIANERYCVEIGPRDMDPLWTFDDVPVDAAAGELLLCCQRHFAHAGNEVLRRAGRSDFGSSVFRLRRGGPTGPIVAVYSVNHQ